MLCCRGIDHHWRDDTFATAGAAVDVWDHQRSEPVTSLTWGADTMHSVRFNPVSSEPQWSGPSSATMQIFKWHHQADTAQA
jgi:DDB1- and CUL4-associated factor 13